VAINIYTLSRGLMISRYTPPFRTSTPPQWRGACAAVAGGGPNRATAIVVARLVFTISGASRAFTALCVSACNFDPCGGVVGVQF